jgi:hypothetical protein
MRAYSKTTKIFSIPEKKVDKNKISAFHLIYRFLFEYFTCLVLVNSNGKKWDQHTLTNNNGILSMVLETRKK